VNRSRRISVRLNPESSERLEKLCQESGNDVSRVVRQALDVFMASKPGMGLINAPPKRLSPPAAIIPLTAPYRAWGNGDARVELRSLFIQLLAVSFALSELYPRTKGPREIYEALLPLVGISEWTRV
jgi:hypothetical protein